MDCQRTDCIERPLSNFFEKLGRIVGTYSVWFFIMPLIVSGILGGGFYFLKDKEDSNIERQFTPRSGPSKIARNFVNENFPNDNTEFSSQRLSEEGNYASILVVSNENILTTMAFKEIINMNNKVNNISIDVDQRTLRFSHLCAKTNGCCVSNDILEIIAFNASRIEQTNITFPIYMHKSRQIFLGSAIGGMLTNAANEVTSAKAVKLVYFLESHNTTAEAWLKEFQKILRSDERDNDIIKVFYYTSQSKQEEIEKHTTDGIPLFSTTYALAIAFSVISCLRLDNVRNKVWVAAIGVFSAGLAVLSSFGLMFYIGIPFVITVANSPFLILGIGVDNMFIMLSNWQQTNVKDPVEKRMAHTYKEAAMSITITTLTDILGFYIGLMSDFPSIQSFCLYTSTAIIFCYVYNITFFGAFLALNGRREGSNRHWLTCMKIASENPKVRSNGCSLCCVGGDYDEDTGTEKVQPINNFFKKYYSPFLIKPYNKVIILFIYAGYLAASIYGCFQIQQGIDLCDLAADDSYVIPYYNNDRQYFSTYGPNVMIIVHQEFPYWNVNKRSELYSCLDDFKKLRFIENNLNISWLNYYESYAQSTHLMLDDEVVFHANLSSFFDEYPVFKQDVNFTANAIHASRFFIQTLHIANASMEIEMVNSLKETAERCSVVPLIVYHPAFIYYDQYAVIVSGTLQNIGVTTAVMLFISLMLIPNPICSLWVTFSVVSVIIGVAGFMALWNVNLDSISMIILVVCIGFTVDFSAHISYAFVSSKKISANERVVDALFTVGYPIVQGASSTILGVVVLAASKNHIFRTFFKIMFLVMVFGLIHGITFVPVFLTLLTRNKDKQKSDLKQDFKVWVKPFSNTVQSQMKLDIKCVAYDNKNFVTYINCYDKPTIYTQHTQNCVIPNKNNLSHSTLWVTDPDCP